MGSAITRYAVPAKDDWPATPDLATGPFDKVNVTVYNGDARFQVRTPNGDWQPVDGFLARRGLFRSEPGLSAVWPPGPSAIRFKRGSTGVAASVDVELYSAE